MELLLLLLYPYLCVPSPPFRTANITPSATGGCPLAQARRMGMRGSVQALSDWWQGWTAWLGSY